ncbi:hypothetical protein C8Q79DRAFT_965613 [Trametes meyenii]|nr:hypothetical protein C8Q79DRAFT_965613 [Trametes meyenii]
MAFCVLLPMFCPLLYPRPTSTEPAETRGHGVGYSESTAQTTVRSLVTADHDLELKATRHSARCLCAGHYVNRERGFHNVLSAALLGLSS